MKKILVISLLMFVSIANAQYIGAVLPRGNSVYIPPTPQYSGYGYPVSYPTSQTSITIYGGVQTSIPCGQNCNVGVNVGVGVSSTK